MFALAANLWPAMLTTNSFFRMKSLVRAWGTPLSSRFSTNPRQTQKDSEEKKKTYFVIKIKRTIVCTSEGVNYTHKPNTASAFLLQLLYCCWSLGVSCESHAKSSWKLQITRPNVCHDNQAYQWKKIFTVHSTGSEGKPFEWLKIARHKYRE